MEMKTSRTFIAVPPGATIREQLDDRGMSQKEFSSRMGMSEKHISRLINGDVQLTGATLQDCHLPQGCNLLCKACQPATPVTPRVSGEKLAVTITYMDAVKGKKDMVVDKSRTVAAVMEDYLAVEAMSALKNRRYSRISSTRSSLLAWACLMEPDCLITV